MEEKERNVGSETVPVSSPVPVKRGKNDERRINFGDTFIKNLKPKNKLYSIGDSKMVGLRLRIEPTGSKIFYYSYKPVNEKYVVRSILNIKTSCYMTIFSKRFVPTANNWIFNSPIIIISKLSRVINRSIIKN